jgi:hypothetical protein
MQEIPREIIPGRHSFQLVPNIQGGVDRESVEGKCKVVTLNKTAEFSPSISNFQFYIPKLKARFSY